MWQHYLRAWAVDGALECLRGTRIFRTGTSRVAYEKDFYRTRLTDEHFDLVERTANRATEPYVRKLHTDWIARLRELQRARKLLESIPADHPLHAEAQQQLDAIECNVEDDHHTAIEAGSIEALDALRREDMTCFETVEAFIAFTHFLAHQYMRTRGAREQYAKEFLREPAYSESVWPVLAHIIGNNISFAMFDAYRRHHTAILRAPDGAEFLTSDRPVVSVLRESADPIARVRYYYPLSPTLALHLGFDGRSEQRATYTLSSSDMLMFNRAIVARSHSQVFASRAESLESFMSNRVQG